MLSPRIADVLWGLHDTSGTYRFAMGYGASLMLGWTLLLLWAYRRPVERRVVRVGGNPVQAGWWLVIGTAILGILVISVAQWLLASWYSITGAAHAGGRSMLVLAIGVVYDLLFFAILVRVLASWLGRGRYTRWLRPFYWLTDWLVEPIRRILPTAGPIDFSPLVALLVLWLLRQLVFQVLR